MNLSAVLCFRFPVRRTGRKTSRRRSTTSTSSSLAATTPFSPPTAPAGKPSLTSSRKKDGYTVAGVQHPETSFDEDIKFTKAVIDRQSGPVVLVGHSYGGAVITEAGNHPKVAGLVYISAFAPDTGESCAALVQSLPPASTGTKQTDDGYIYIDPAVFHADFAADLPAAKAAFMAESQVLISADSFPSPVKTPAWKSKPTWYLVATADRSINPDQERMMA